MKIILVGLSMLLFSLNIYAAKFNRAEIKQFARCGEASNSLAYFTQWLMKHERIAKEDANESINYSVSVMNKAILLLKDVKKWRYKRTTKKLRKEFKRTYEEQGHVVTYRKYAKMVADCDSYLSRVIETQIN